MDRVGGDKGGEDEEPVVNVIQVGAVHVEVEQ